MVKLIKLNIGKKGINQKMILVLRTMIMTATVIVKKIRKVLGNQKKLIKLKKMIAAVTK